MKVWIAKDEEEHVYLFKSQPEKRDGYWCGTSGGWEIDLMSYRTLKFTNNVKILGRWNVKKLT